MISLVNAFSLKPVNKALAEGQLEADTQLPGVPFGRKHVDVSDGEDVVGRVAAGEGCDVRSDGVSRGASVGVSMGGSSSSGSSSASRSPSSFWHSGGSLSGTRL